MSVRAFRPQPARGGGASLALAALLFASCLQPASRTAKTEIYSDPAPSANERYCAWYGDARDGVLYFGAAAFWSAMRAHGNDPLADLLAEGPVAIGRFDLRAERMLEPLAVGVAGDRSGSWDVLAHPNGRIYFTTFYDAAGYVDASSAEFRRLPDLGAGLNELALGPGGALLASRYGSASEPHGSGSIALFDPDGSLLDEFPLEAPAGFRVAPKTVAFDPLRAEIWITTDLLPLDPETPLRHDTYVLGIKGELLQRIAEPEIQYVRFAADGTGYRAEVETRNLWLRVSAPGAGPASDQRILLDGAFASSLDFVQDIALGSHGRAVVTRWSGWVHVVDPPREVRSTRLPQFSDAGLYYSAVAEGDRLCATYCADVNVVCRKIP